MTNQVIKNGNCKNHHITPYELKLEFENYLRQRKKFANKKLVFEYNETKITLTKKQIKVLFYIAQGYSNQKIAKELGTRETAVKLLIYRLMKYLESTLYEQIDRYYLIIVAQKLHLENFSQE